MERNNDRGLWVLIFQVQVVLNHFQVCMKRLGSLFCDSKVRPVSYVFSGEEFKKSPVC